MTIAEHKIELAQKLLSIKNKNTLKAIDLLISQEDDTETLLTSEQKKDLDRRVKEFEAGEAKTYTWEETKARVRKKK